MTDLTPILLGLVEGATEFLPVSSTAHLILADEILGGGQSAAFEIAMQVGAILAVVAFEWRLIARIVMNARSLVRLAGTLALAFLPAAVIGLALHDAITTYLFSLPVIGGTLLLGGIAMLVLEKTFAGQTSVKIASPDELTYGQALAIGCAQILALVPGVSRAAATIYGGLAVRLPRTVATEFSFLLAVPVLGAASFYEIFLNAESQLTLDADFLIATGSAFVFALVALQVLFAWVKRHDFRGFAWYRIALGAGILAWTLS